MPTRTGRDKKGCYARWGSQKKYYYRCGDEKAKQRAIARANKQGAAIRAAGWTEKEDWSVPDLEAGGGKLEPEQTPPCQPGYKYSKKLGKCVKAKSYEIGLLKSFVSKADKGIRFVIGRLKGKTSTTVQTVVFDKKRWTKAQAAKWLKDNGFKAVTVRETGNSYRFRQRPPEDFEQKSFRTINPSK